MEPTVIAAPSAAAPVAPTVAVPSATPAQPSILADFASLAAKSLEANSTPPQPAPEVPAPESPSESPAIPDPEPAQPSPEVAPATAPEGDEVPEPTAEEQAAWSEGEKKLHGALVKERQNRKDAKTELRTLRAEFDALKAKVNTPPEPTNSPAGETPAQVPQPTPVAGDMLADCATFEAVDARAMQAATTEAQVLKVQTTLARQGLEAATAKLKESGVEKIGNLPLAEATEEQVGDFLAAIYEGTRITQLQATGRKQFLMAQAGSWQEAVQKMPELADAKSENFKAVSQLIQQNPDLKRRANWPVIAVKLVLGEQAYKTKTASTGAPATNGHSAPPVPAPKPEPKPAARQAPGAPRTSNAALPQKSEYETAAERVRNGSGTLQDINTMARAATRAVGVPA